MLTVITYDVNTEDPAGQRRLRKVARHCVNYGQRVQNSVFECVADAAEMVRIKNKLVELIDPEKDSLRFYYLGNKYQTKIEHVGAKPTYEAEGFLAL
ncbi:CRISPR-associated endonuclease Cas2 [Rubneribacter badeniensis]|uniref:CRISPR-associated endoribonuclease Cas2 n=1 Tax=Rubneribacter badeniensis TaxID=2070688 RepID=A0A2K2U7Z4_9ACTN|nr:CRISPR-associated endonuclease Cas2 [Rubneribacter badeniensis]OUO95385.1 CRISPR-associated endonuclease Cas2 [Gordonibacter sp. An232A]PNV66389.1 CRISPR-associated endonuclease Cas2 [Rubneribacter badeniensis]CVH75388.1 CRISPR-associated endoribonuclease Cas2 [Coriobacteriaceae bacterium CHKCI002]HJH42471.1 CRISPR-associated endonuclease Cas2 [Rubneribacter badeniensis]